MCAPERRARAAVGAWRTAAREAPGGLYFRRFPDFRRFPATSAASRPAARGSVSGSSQLVPGRGAPGRAQAAAVRLSCADR